MPKRKIQEIKKSKVKSLNLPKVSDPSEMVFEKSDSDNESLDSDQELQLAFARKQLLPGLNIPTVAPKVYPNDEETMERKLKEIYLNMEWIERLDITTPRFEVAEPDAEGIVPSLVDNDFQRESIFLKQAQAAVEMALPRLKGFNVSVRRPEDYFAEMSKSDNHMKKVRAKLLSKHAEIEKRDKIRKLRELKKMGKTIQVENEQKKAKAKKTVYKSEKQFTEANENESKKAKRDTQNKKIGKDNKKKTFKEAKYGFGGRKKRSKYNTAESSADAFKANRKKNGGAKVGGKQGKAPFRRAGNKNKPKNTGKGFSKKK